MSDRFRILRWSALPLITFVLSAPAFAESDEGIRFNRDIRSILSNKCYACHGPDKNARKGDLRLDVESLAKADRGDYFVIDSAHPEKSEFLNRINTTDEDDQMPPADSGK